MSEELATRGVSWKALLVAAVAYALTFVFIAAVVKAVVASALFAGYGYKASRAFDAIHTMPSVAISGRLLSLLGAALAAGYVAARTAQAKQVLNGTLATITPILICLYILTFSPVAHDTEASGAWLSSLFDMLTFVGGPMLGALGGYLADRREVHIARVLEETALDGLPPTPTLS
jgi:hypothetical protein